MNIIWDEDKSTRLKKERGISFEEVANLILEKKYVDIVLHPNRAGQRMFLIPIDAYIHVVPFVLDDENNFVLKTIFPGRKFQKKYEGKEP